MAIIRTARVVAAFAALPLAAGLLGGVAHADSFDSGSFAGYGSNASVGTIIGSGVGGTNNGNSATTQQIATGGGASNQSNTAGVVGTGPTVVGQSNVDINFVSFVPTVDRS
ncbi:hypothetical protein [Streptomyces aidingensis]|uniref:Secreted protein n=1 Tax=Streptomyces aidingensis TaxID=910347 RepID=A0A1I1QCN6_9ACTN|nr:hypothetical protein [Streptomyces aidingensis]SFD19797.1 hypothetical protein SAMN05421773_11125 [Streptomyces aidingensis]